MTQQGNPDQTQEETYNVIKEEDPPPAFALTELDQKILSMTDEEYQPHSWGNLRQLIGEAKMPPHIVRTYPKQEI